MSTNSGTPGEFPGETPSNLPGGLPLFTSGWGGGNIQFTDESSFWDDVNRLINEGQLAGSLDGAMAGHSSPRVWLFLHEPGEAHLSVAAALNFSRELAIRDQAVLLLDGNDEEADLTRWCGRTDMDGWIDLVRYGSSVLSCGIPMPFEGRRGYLLGVGSFTPADVTGPEVGDLLARLKRQADDILVTAPANAVGRLWASEANIRLLCWDRANRSASVVTNLLEDFDSVEASLTGLVGFGLPGEFEDEPSAAAHSFEDDSDHSFDHQTEPSLDVDEKSEVYEGSASAILSELERQDEEILDDEQFARRKGNSNVFWMVAVVSVLMITVASAYFIKYLKVPSGGRFPSVTQNKTIPTEPGDGQSFVEGAASFDSGLTSLQGAAVENSTDQTLDQQNQVEDSTTEVADDFGEGSIPASTQDEIPAETQPVSSDQELPVVAKSLPASSELVKDEVVDVVKAPAGFGMDPYLGTVGSDGWTLHVYSFPDSLQAENERIRLAVKGFQSISRAVEFKDKGRWYRVYLGSFESKSEANKARLELMKKLGEDWANPVRF